VSELATLMTTPGMPDFMAAAAAAVPRLRALPSGLPDDPIPCLAWTPQGKLLGLHPDWLFSTGSLATQPMHAVAYPATVRYMFKKWQLCHRHRLSPDRVDDSDESGNRHD
jgi:hypothetical protein